MHKFHSEFGHSNEMTEEKYSALNTNRVVLSDTGLEQLAAFFFLLWTKPGWLFKLTVFWL